MDNLPARVRMFVLGCALRDGTEGLKTYYSSLGVDGWLIELARTHGRFILGSWTHDEFGAWLGLRDDELGRAYRAMLKRADIDRDELVQVARRLLATQDRDAVRALQRSAELVRFRRMREAVERRTSNIGRPTVAADTDGPMGRQLEKWRMSLHVSIDDWCQGLGMVSTTYRSRLAHEKNPRYREKMEQLIKDGKSLYCRLAAPVIARYPVVDPQELADAYAVIANHIESLRNEMLTDAAPDTATQVIGVNEKGPEEFLPLDLYSWMRPPAEEETPA